MLIYNYFIGCFTKIIIESFSFPCSIMNIKLLLLVSAVIEIVFLEKVTNKNQIEIDIIPQSGLLVERQHEVNFMRKTWKIVICLDFSWLKYDLTAIELSFENIREDASVYRKDYIKYMSQFDEFRINLTKHIINLRRLENYNQASRQPCRPRN